MLRHHRWKGVAISEGIIEGDIGVIEQLDGH